MTRESGSDAFSRFPACMVDEGAVDARAAEAIESVEYTELPFHFEPARGIRNGVMIGAGAWIVILAAVALTRSVFFG